MLTAIPAMPYDHSGRISRFRECAGQPVLDPLMAPVGLRFHATHHLFPSLPYHALGKAHRKLVQELPDNSLYLEASRASMFDALKRIWQETREGQNNRAKEAQAGQSRSKAA